jgi:hypothetical protein
MRLPRLRRSISPASFANAREHPHYALHELPSRHCSLGPGEDPALRDDEFLQAVIERSLWHMGHASEELDRMPQQREIYWQRMQRGDQEARRLLVWCDQREQLLHEEMEADGKGMQRATAELARRALAAATRLDHASVHELAGRELKR